MTFALKSQTRKESFVSKAQNQTLTEHMNKDKQDILYQGGLFCTKEEIISSNLAPSGSKNVCYLLLDEVNSLTYQPYEAAPQ